jgi:hypothetical protein
VTRPRGLCWVCFYRPDVRQQYTTIGKGGYRSEPDTNRNVPASGPTTAAAGSIEKLRVMRQRFLRGESLFHEADNLARTDQPSPFAAQTYRNGEPSGLDEEDSDETGA